MPDVMLSPRECERRFLVPAQEQCRPKSAGAGQIMPGFSLGKWRDTPECKKAIERYRSCVATVTRAKGVLPASRRPAAGELFGLPMETVAKIVLGLGAAAIVWYLFYGRGR